MNELIIREAIQSYHSQTTPDAVRKAALDAASQGHPQSEADILWNAAMVLRDVIERETEKGA